MIKNVIDKNKNFELGKDKILKLKEIFPGCFTKDGQLDIAAFENEVKVDTKVVKEGYGLNFLGKNYAKLLASLDTETILIPDSENNSEKNNKNSKNIYITGDNIDALKHLVKSYSNEVKCIYIDPPYNTGSDGFVYNDSFSFSVDKLISTLDVDAEEAKRIYDMTNRQSSSHSAWLTFMYPRLYLAKQLLSRDGVIFISIGEDEVNNLKLLCDNIFGEINFVVQFVWEKHKAPKNDNKYVTMNHEYILMYARDKENFVIKMDDRNDQNIATFKNEDNDPRGPWISSPLLAPTFSNSTVFPIINPNGDEIMPPVGKCWSYNEDGIKRLLDDNRIWFGHDGSNVPRIKRFLSELPEGIVPRSLLFHDIYGGNQKAANELKKLFDGKKIFDYSKPIELIEYFIEKANGDDMIVMDFFSGSATTAHACMNINSRLSKNIKYIMVQWQEACDEKSEAYKNGYKTIDEIGQERIRRAAKKIKKETNAKIDYGFKHYIVKEINTNTLDRLEKFEPNFMLSDETLLNDFGVNAILTTWINEDGYGITDQYESLDLAGYCAYKCENTIYLINSNLSNNSIKELVNLYQNNKSFRCNRIVLFGYSFTISEIQTLKDNIKQVKNIKGINVEIITRY